MKVSENIVKNLGGKMAFKSVHKIGSIFEFTIPLE